LQNCWNCGRKAYETCSGCHRARYCGTFCQHRHWETHHLTCRPTSSLAADRTQPPGGSTTANRRMRRASASPDSESVDDSSVAVRQSGSPPAGNDVTPAAASRLSTGCESAVEPVTESNEQTVS
jgi:hypothetical protein